MHPKNPTSSLDTLPNAGVCHCQQVLAWLDTSNLVLSMPMLLLIYQAPSHCTTLPSLASRRGACAPRASHSFSGYFALRCHVPLPTGVGLAGHEQPGTVHADAAADLPGLLPLYHPFLLLPTPLTSPEKRVRPKIGKSSLTFSLFIYLSPSLPPSIPPSLSLASSRGARAPRAPHSFSGYFALGCHVPLPTGVGLAGHEQPGAVHADAAADHRPCRLAHLPGLLPLHQLRRPLHRRHVGCRARRHRRQPIPQAVPATEVTGQTKRGRREGGKE